MAEINIQKKQKPIWPWIIGIIVIIAAIVLLGREETREEAVQAIAPTTDETREVPEEINEYIAYIRETSPTHVMGLDHDYTAESLRKLSSALEALTTETDTDGDEINGQTERIDETADFIQKDPLAQTHADSIKTAFQAATDVIVAVQQQNFPELSEEAQRLSSTASEIDPNVLTLDQNESVRKFFNESASTLEAMAKRWNGNGNGNGNGKKRMN